MPRPCCGAPTAPWAARTCSSISFAGSGTGATFGQAYEPGGAWPKITYSSFSRLADYDHAAFREDAARSRAEPTGGGAVPLMGTGEQRTTGLMRGGYAWNLVGPAPVASPRDLDARVHDLWTTPHGVIKAALANQPTLTTRTQDGRTLRAVSFVMPGRLRAMALINADGLVEQIESVQPNPVMGDTGSVITFSDYQDFGGVKFPKRIRQSLGGFPVLDLTVSEVKPNAPAAIEVPALVSAATEKVTADKVAEGVWFLAGGSHNSVAIEMKDHLMVVESPLFDGRAAADAGAKRRSSPPASRSALSSTRTTTSTIRAACAPPWPRAPRWSPASWRGPTSKRRWPIRTVSAPMRWQKSGRTAQLTGVNGQRRFTDGDRVVDVHYIEGSVHARGFMMVHLPREKLLIEADAFTPGPPGAPPPATPNALHVNLVQNMERLNLQVEKILPLHGRVVPVAELYTAVGRKN